MKNDVKQTIFGNNDQTAELREVGEIGINYPPFCKVQWLKNDISFTE